MSYIGSPPSTQSFAPGTDTFSGDGTTVAFTLSRNVGTVNDILVVVNNVDQQPTAYSVSVSTLTFTAAPSSGTNNIYVRYLSTNLTAIVPQAGSVGIPAFTATGTPSSTTFFRGDNTWATPVAASGSVVQVVNVQTGAFASGTAIIPIDNTIPQITEGTQLFTLAITPTSATSKLKFDIVVNAGINSQNWVSIALFQGSTANAIAAMSGYLTTSGSANPLALNYYMTSGTTSPITFSLRFGPLGNTMGINGTTSQLFGGVQISSMTITEIAP